MTPEQRSQRARIAAYTSWANTADPAKRTAPARQSSMSRFERQVDPEGELPEAERQRRAQAAMKAHMTRMAYKAARARTKPPIRLPRRRDNLSAVVPCRRRVPLPPESTSDLASSKGSMGDRRLMVERQPHQRGCARSCARIARRHPRASGRARRRRVVEATPRRLRVPRISLKKPVKRSCGKRTKGSSRTTKTQAGSHAVTP